MLPNREPLVDRLHRVAHLPQASRAHSPDAEASTGDRAPQDPTECDVRDDAGDRAVGWGLPPGHHPGDGRDRRRERALPGIRAAAGASGATGWSADRGAGGGAEVLSGLTGRTPGVIDACGGVATVLAGQRSGGAWRGGGRGLRGGARHVVRGAPADRGAPVERDRRRVRHCGNLRGHLLCRLDAVRGWRRPGRGGLVVGDRGSAVGDDRRGDRSPWSSTAIALGRDVGSSRPRRHGDRRKRPLGSAAARRGRHEHGATGGPRQGRRRGCLPSHLRHDGGRGSQLGGLRGRQRRRTPRRLERREGGGVRHDRRTHLASPWSSVRGSGNGASAVGDEMRAMVASAWSTACCRDVDAPCS